MKLFSQNNKSLKLILLLTIINTMVVACSNYGYRSSNIYHPSTPRLPEDNTPTIEGAEIMLFALGLIDTKYTYGGKNPEAGLDCSGLVSHVYKNAVDINLTGNAASQALKGRSINRQQLRVGDLIFFNTTGKPFSHVGIYVGKNRFIHAPNSRGLVRLESMLHRYWGKKIIDYRTYLN